MADAIQPGGAALVSFFQQTKAEKPTVYNVPAVRKMIEESFDTRADYRDLLNKILTFKITEALDEKTLLKAQDQLLMLDTKVQVGMQTLDGYLEDGQIDPQETRNIDKALVQGMTLRDPKGAVETAINAVKKGTQEEILNAFRQLGQ